MSPKTLACNGEHLNLSIIFWLAAWCLKWKQYVYPLLHMQSARKPSPSFLYVIRCLSLWLPWNPIVCLSHDKCCPRYIASLDTFDICFNNGWTFQFGDCCHDGVGNVGFVEQKKLLKCLCLRLLLLVLPPKEVKTKSLPFTGSSLWGWNFISICGEGDKPCNK